MFRNRNGYWMSPEFYAMFAPDDGAGSGAGAAGDPGNGSDGDGNNGNDGAGGDNGGDNSGDNGAGGGADLAEKLAKAEADLLKYKAAIDKATKEASDAKKALRAKQSAEEIAAEEKKAADEKAAQEIEELRREVARTKAVKSVMSRLGTDEETSGRIAECLYGAEDVDNALTEIQRAWTAREKALKLEYGKVPPPGAGGANGADEETERAIRLAKEIGHERAKVSESVQAQLKGLIR